MAIFKHGKSRTSEYKIWRNMLNRCNNPKRVDFPYYGGRGIKVCSDWNDFTIFLKDMGLRPSKHHSLDRINNNGPYSSDNCKWSLIMDQNLNRRVSNKTGFIGISKDTRGKCYHSRIRIHGNYFYLGYFSEKEEAAIMYGLVFELIKNNTLKIEESNEP